MHCWILARDNSYLPQINIPKLPSIITYGTKIDVCFTPTKELSVPMKSIAAFLKNENGATAIEYGLIAAGISVAIIAVVNGVGTQLNSTFTSVKNAIAGQ